MNTRRILIPALCAGLFLIAAAGAYLLWPDSAPSPEEKPAATAPIQTLAGPQESAAPGNVPMPDLEAIIHQASADGGKAGAEKMTQAIAEARRRAAADPKAAFAWAMAQPREEQAAAVEVVLSEWTETNPTAAFDAALFIDGKDAALRNKALATVLTEWAGWDPDAAWKTTQKLPSDSKERALIEMQIAMRWAATDADAAAKALAQGAALTGFYTELAPAFGTVAHELAVRDATKATAWAMALPQGAAQSGAVSAIVSAWVAKDAAAAAMWVEQLPAGTTRDAGVMTLIGSGMEIDPEKGIRWAETLGRPELRATAVSQFALRWLGAQPAQAKAWLEESTALTAVQKKELLDIAAKLPPLPGGPAEAQNR